MASLRHAVSRRFDWRIHGDTARGRVHHHRRRPPVEIVLVRLWHRGMRVYGLGFGVWGLGFGVWGMGLEVWGLEFQV